MNDSAVRFLYGLFGKSRDFPVSEKLGPRSKEYIGSARPEGKDDFLLLSSFGESCPRMLEINKQIQQNEGRIALKQKIISYLERHYFRTLRKLLEKPNLSHKELFKYASYIYWAL